MGVRLRRLMTCLVFAIALRKGQLLSAEMTQAMLTPKVLEDDEPYRGYLWKYGYGNFFPDRPGGEGAQMRRLYVGDIPVKRTESVVACTTTRSKI